MRQGGPEVQRDVCICRLKFGKSLEETEDNDLQNITCQRGLKKTGGSLAWESLRGKEGNMPYANFQIYRGLL